uniref:CHAT domain-containing protein n=1 Tax=Candidatus Kentrum sp. TUN TaxID=2126343 RepID=A0A451AMJ3_9GAMM|nr:MAG: hypothetical protein BECKTUN1418F_GA0071002_11665 [Candidatus Kentron sp. TUN]VFK67249.1 MAG: hypothetical protein BECKTUN1418E_GA0071001_11386 [Candidatus Kentron sp. TUN]
MSTKKEVILVRPRSENDNITAHTHAWSEGVRQLFEESDWTVMDCSIEKATRKFVEEALRTWPDSLFVFYGHGAVDALIGQGGGSDIEVIDFRNVELLGKRKVYVMACDSATKAGLGYKAVKEHGALVYFGYADEVWGYWGNRKDKEYGGMMYALGECVNSGLRVWLARPKLTAGEIEQKMKKVYEGWIDYYTEIDDIDYLVAARFSQVLFHNMDALELLGDKQTRLHAH